MVQEMTSKPRNYGMAMVVLPALFVFVNATVALPRLVQDDSITTKKR
jgi:hypothetical protein